MKVKELIEFLKTQDENLTVIYRFYSDYDVLEADDIRVENYRKKRPDGYIHTHGLKDPDVELETYLVFPGN